MTETLAYAFGRPAVGGVLRAAVEDFQVMENLGFAPDGDGEHVFLRVRKRGANTDWVARRLAAFAGVTPMAVGYAGLKDRQAVAEQWFSVHLPAGARDWPACREADFEVLEAVRHSRKLRRGALRGNAFRIVIRGLDGPREDLERRLARLGAMGAPNYFGDQRFGREGGNLAAAEAMLAGQRIRDRHRRGLYLSAARAHLFNQVLSRRVAEGTWNTLLDGEVLMLEGSHSVFAAVADDTLRQRVADQDLHPTGPLWGSGELLSGGTVRALEQAVADAWPVLSRGLAEAGLRQERRALRVRVQALAWEDIGADAGAVSFQLPAGAYATAVLRELVAA
ncbi:MAG: tRNA pseudouridine(13) synthase TruD [Pseudomonadota bacterium]|nr:tRNA pseudouridine(13) synthase TruD [Pseudomonadota bacterium]